jgi:hypothetical protein
MDFCILGSEDLLATFLQTSYLEYEVAPQHEELFGDLSQYIKAVLFSEANKV